MTVYGSVAALFSKFAFIWTTAYNINTSFTRIRNYLELPTKRVNRLLILVLKLFVEICGINSWRRLKFAVETPIYRSFFRMHASLSVHNSNVRTQSQHILTYIVTIGFKWSGNVVSASLKENSKAGLLNQRTIQCTWQIEVKLQS